MRLVKVLIVSCFVFPSPLYAVEMTPRQTQLFINNCGQCHTRAEMWAPQVGDVEQWRDRLSQGEETLLQHVIEGYKSMPPLGYCSACDEDDFRAMVKTLQQLATPSEVGND